MNRHNVLELSLFREVVGIFHEMFGLDSSQLWILPQQPLIDEHPEKTTQTVKKQVPHIRRPHRDKILMQLICCAIDSGQQDAYPTYETHPMFEKRMPKTPQK